jgi:hypothetical protein
VAYLAAAVLSKGSIAMQPTVEWDEAKTCLDTVSYTDGEFKES